MHFASFLVTFCFLRAILANKNDCPETIARLQWGGIEPKQVEYSIKPIEYVIIHHTVTPECQNEDECSELIASMQDFHINSLKFHDIGYNFIIGGDGNVYEGVGWHKVGAHTIGYNSRSIGIGIIGNFTSVLPNNKQIEATKRLLRCGVSLGELDTRYKLLGARQVTKTKSPGLKLYREIQTWPNFSRSP